MLFIAFWYFAARHAYDSYGEYLGEGKSYDNHLGKRKAYGNHVDERRIQNTKPFDITEDKAKDIEKIIKLEQQLKAESKAKQAYALRMQMMRIFNNDHFLGNLIDNIATLARTDPDRNKAADAIIKFGRLYKDITSTQENRIRLEKEVAFTTRYLELEQLRNPKLTYSITGYEMVNKYQEIPLLLIQSAVNNACKHGFAGHFYKQRGGHIHIDMRQDKTYLVIKIEDNGKGYSKEQVKHNKAEKEKKQQFAIGGIDYFEEIFGMEANEFSRYRSRMTIAPIYSAIQSSDGKKQTPIGTQVIIKYCILKP